MSWCTQIFDRLIFHGISSMILLMSRVWSCAVEHASHLPLWVASKVLSGRAPTRGTPAACSLSCRMMVASEGASSAEKTTSALSFRCSPRTCDGSRHTSTLKIQLCHCKCTCTYLYHCKCHAHQLVHTQTNMCILRKQKSIAERLVCNTLETAGYCM